MTLLRTQKKGDPHRIAFFCAYCHLFNHLVDHLFDGLFVIE